MANILNRYFCSVFSREGSVGTVIRNNSGKKLNSLEIREEDVLEKIGNLKLGKAAGPDGISATFLIKCKELIARPLTIIFNKSLKEGNVPQDWKCANITPLFKKGCKQEPGNYRPISLTSIACKILEGILKKEILEHINNEVPLNNSQHGFMTRRSCLTNLLEYLEKVTEILDSGGSMDVIYLDFSKAFDKVPHQRLLNKLENFGISGEIKSWIQNWLTGRTQRVVINGCKSDWELVLSGIPQDSVLGPFNHFYFL